MADPAQRPKPLIVVGAICLPTLLAACSAVLLFLSLWVGRYGFNLTADSGEITFASQFWTFSVFGFMEHVYLFSFWMLVLPLVAIFLRPDWRAAFALPYVTVPLWLLGSVITFVISVILWNVMLKLVVFRSMPDLGAICGILKLMFMRGMTR